MAIREAQIPTGTRVTFSVPEGQEAQAFYRAEVERYATEAGDMIPAQVEVAWVLETALVVDLLQKPERLTWSNGALSIARTGGDDVVGRVIPVRLFEAGYKVSNRATRLDWSPTRPDLAMSPAERELDHQRATMVLAQISILREVVSTAAAREVAARVAATERAGGWVGAAIVAGSVVTAALCFRQYLAHLESVEVIQSASAERVARARIAEAGQDYAARLAQLRATGSMPPPSAVETAVAADVERRAASEWGDFWQGAERTAKGVSRYFIAALAFGVALKLAK